MSNQQRNQVTLQIGEDVDDTPQPDPNPRQSFGNWTLQATSRLLPDQPRQGLSNGLNYVFREITPLVGHVNNANPSTSTWFNRNTSNIQELVRNQHAQLPNRNILQVIPSLTHINLGPGATTYPPSVQPNPANPRSTHEPVVSQPIVPNLNINIDDNQNNRVTEQNPPEPAAANGGENANNNNPNARPDILTLFREIIKIAPLFLILLTKFTYDHREGLLTFITLLITFYHANGVVKDELSKLTNRNFKKLILEFNYIICCIFLLDYVFSYGRKYASLLMFIPSYTQPFDLWELLWMLCISDFILKLLTIDIKIVITCMPEKILPFPKRGKIYFFIEATSQLYRSLIPIQPWLYFLLEAYQGPEKAIGVLLSSAYLVSKSLDVIRKANLFKKAGLQLLKTSNLGVSPNSEQLEAAGKICPICHDEYFAPIRLKCTHIFCELCVARWLDKIQTCPLCRAQVIADSSWRDGSTSQYLQFY